MEGFNDMSYETNKHFVEIEIARHLSAKIESFVSKYKEQQKQIIRASKTEEEAAKRLLKFNATIKMLTSVAKDITTALNEINAEYEANRPKRERAREQRLRLFGDTRMPR